MLSKSAEMRLKLFFVPPPVEVVVLVCGFNSSSNRHRVWKDTSPSAGLLGSRMFILYSRLSGV